MSPSDRPLDRDLAWTVRLDPDQSPTLTAAAQQIGPAPHYVVAARDVQDQITVRVAGRPFYLGELLADLLTMITQAFDSPAGAADVDPYAFFLTGFLLVALHDPHRTQAVTRLVRSLAVALGLLEEPAAP